MDKPTHELMRDVASHGRVNSESMGSCSTNRECAPLSGNVPCNDSFSALGHASRPLQSAVMFALMPSQSLNGDILTEATDSTARDDKGQQTLSP